MFKMYNKYPVTNVNILGKQLNTPTVPTESCWHSRGDCRVNTESVPKPRSNILNKHAQISELYFIHPWSHTGRYHISFCRAQSEENHSCLMIQNIHKLGRQCSCIGLAQTINLTGTQETQKHTTRYSFNQTLSRIQENQSFI